MSTLKVGTIQDHANGNTGIELHSTGGVKTFKRPQVHLASTKSDATYSVTNNDFSLGGSFGLQSGTSAIDCSFDANGKMTVTHAGLYMLYCYVYLYTNSTTGTMSISGYKGTTGNAPYGYSSGTQFANIDVFEWNGTASGRIDRGLGGQVPVVLAAGEACHVSMSNTDVYSGNRFHRVGLYKLD